MEILENPKTDQEEARKRPGRGQEEARSGPEEARRGPEEASPGGWAPQGSASKNPRV